MTELPIEVQRARSLLCDVEALPGAEVRVYRRIMATPSRQGIAGLRFSVVGLGLLLSASAALGFGLAPRWIPPSPTVATTAVPKPSPPRQLPRGAAPRVNKPSRDASTSSEDDSGFPSLDEPAPIAPTAQSSLLNPTGSEPAIATRTDEVAVQSRSVKVRPRSVTAASSVAANSVEGSPAAHTGRDGAAGATPPVSALSLQVAEYQSAVENLDAQPAEALTRLRAYRRKWPNSAIQHEVDLRIVQVLVRLGRDGEARAAAQAFLVQYPNSARAAEVRRIAEFDRD